MDAALAGLVGAALGAVVGLLGPAITAWQQHRTELQRAEINWSENLAENERQSMLELAKLLATGIQAISWVAWAVAAFQRSG